MARQYIAMQVNLNPITGIPGESYNYVEQWMSNPIMLFIVLTVILLYYTLFASVGRAPTATGNGGANFLEILMWGVLLTVVLMNGLRYFYGANIVANISKLFSQEPELDITVTTDKGPSGPAPVPEITFEKQVFHVPGNTYSFDDAKAVCAAYGGRLASYNEIEDAYEDGADWCSYGWSDKQMALFPTQKDKWDKLQKIKGHEHDCGRPGVNGGYIANPNVKFGINCYGYKPDITKEEQKRMSESDGLPVTKKQQEFKKLVDHWKKKVPEIIVAPFNHNNWSAF